MIILKTETIETEFGPSTVLCKGHVDIETFNRAHLAEGWDVSEYELKDLYYTYATKDEKGWTWGLKADHEGARPVTVCQWD